MKSDAQTVVAQAPAGRDNWVKYSRGWTQVTVRIFTLEAALDAAKRCTVKGEPAGRWGIYSTELVSSAASVVSPLGGLVECRCFRCVVCRRSLEGQPFSWSEALLDRSVLRCLLVDLGLLALFATQHSLLAWSPVKQALQSVLGVLNRTAYCFTTALALQVLMRCWQPVTGAPCLWSVRHVPWSIWIPLLCFTLHFVCWAIICSILIIFDYTELLGIKQVYYECLGLGDPLSHKSPPAQRLLSHLRHPVCLELAVVLWLLPALSLDRLLLAGTLSTYLALAHSLDKQDLAYLCIQLKAKMQVWTEPQRGDGDGAGSSSSRDNGNHKQK